MKRLAATLLIAALACPTAATAETPDLHDPKQTVEQAVADCKSSYADDKPLAGPFSVATICELKAWATLGRHYPSLADKALKVESKLNEVRGQVNSLRKQLRRERQHTDELSMKLGKQQARLNELKGRWPQWATWALSAGALIVGGAAGYGVGQLAP